MYFIIAEYQARQNLVTFELATHKLTELKHPGGFYGMGMTFAPTAELINGEIIAGWQDAVNPPQLIALDGRTGQKTRTVLSAGEVPPGHAWKHVTFKSTDGETIQGWLGLPDGQAIPDHPTRPWRYQKRPPLNIFCRIARRGSIMGSLGWLSITGVALPVSDVHSARKSGVTWETFGKLKTWWGHAVSL